MIIKRVVLKNIRSYKEADFSFPRGIVLFSGDIGSGKSSVLLAIEFALFGLLKGALSAESLLRNGKKEGFVQLEFEIANKKIIVKRHLKRHADKIKQEAGYIVVDGVKQDATPLELKSKILSILGYPEELVTKSKSLIYRYTVYTPQELMKQILFEDSEERLNTLRKVFGIDKYKRIVENTSFVLKNLRENKREIKGMISDLESKQSELNEMKSNLDKKEQELSLTEPKIQSINKELLDVKESLTIAEKEKNSLNELKNRFSFLIKNLSEKKESEKNFKENSDTLNKEILDLNNKKEKIKIEKFAYDEKQIEDELKESKKESEKISEDVLRLKEKLSYLKRESEILKEKISKKKTLKFEETEEKIKKLNQKISFKKKLENDIENIELFLDEVNKKISERQFKIKSLEDTLKRIFEFDNCPTCLQSVSMNHKRDIKLKKEEEENEFNFSLKKLNEEKVPKEKILLDLKQALNVMLENEKDLIGLKVSFEKIKEENLEIIEAEKNMPVFSSKEQKNKEELEEKQSLLSKSKEKTEKFEEMMIKLKDQQVLLKEKQNIENLKDNLQKQIENSKKQLIEIYTSIEKLDSEISSISEKIEEKKDIEKKYICLKEKSENLLNKEKNQEILFSAQKKEFEMLSISVKKLSVDVDSKLKSKKKLERLTKLQTFFETDFINLMLSMEKHVMVSIYGEFSEFFSKWFSILVDDSLLSSRIDEDFSPKIIQNGFETEIGNLSGGEKTAVALAYRLALNRVINDIVSSIKTKNIIILDEPTDGFSSDQLDKMRDVLHQLNMKQIIIVSHEPKIESYADKIIRLFKREHNSQALSY